MPRLRCPRCASVIESMPGTMPVCPTCGFGSKAKAAAPAAPVPPVATVGRTAPAAPARAPVAAAPPAAPSAAPQPGRRGAILAVCLVGVLVLAGAAAAVAYFAMRDGPAAALSEEEARSRVAASLQSAGQALTGEATDGDLRKVTMRMESEPGSPGSPEDLFFSGPGDMRVTIEYGREGRVRFDLHMASGAVTVAFTMICTPERQYLVAGGQAYASRPAVEPRGTGSMCQGIDEAGMDEMVPPLDELEAEDAAITRNADGSLRAIVEDAEDGRFVVEIDAAGRVRTITATPPADEGIGRMTMTFDYGSRSTIPLPTAFKLMPATVELDRESEGARHTWTVQESPEAPPLADFEARVRDWSDDGSLASFELDGSLQEEANLTFRFTDADGDGRLTAGDSFVVTDLSGSGAVDAGAEDDFFSFGYSFFPYDLVLYDRVAEAEVNSGFAQAPVPGWLAVAGLALGAIALRRRRQA